MSAAIWDLPLPYVPTDAFEELFDDAPPCPYRLHVPAGSLSLGPLSCSVDHRASGLDWLHGALLAGRSVEWTTVQAAESRAVYLASAGPACSECPRPAVARGLCRVCTDAELARDDYETESEDAAL